MPGVFVLRSIRQADIYVKQEVRAYLGITFRNTPVPSFRISVLHDNTDHRPGSERPYRGIFVLHRLVWTEF